MTNPYFPHDDDYADEIHWSAISSVLQHNFYRRGAVTLDVTVFSRKDDLRLRRVRLSHLAFQEVTLTLEQVDLILHHLHNPCSTEAVFVMAQTLADGLDLDLVYDVTTGKLKMPHARLQEVA